VEETNTSTAPDAEFTETRRTVIRSLAFMLKQEPESLTGETRLFEDLSFDSTGLLELLMQLETDLDLEFDPETLEPADFATIDSLVVYVLKERAA
jgi:acyl carrier protein